MKIIAPSRILLTLVALCLAASWARATPYASSITNSGTAISFRLNESADSVKIISDGGTTTNDLGVRAFGLHTVALAIVGTFQIEVSKGPSLGYLNGVTNLISADTNVLLRFNAPRGVAVNRNPASPYFGRIYVANADTGSVAVVGAFPARNMVLGDGIYALNGDFTDALGQGNVARTLGLNWRSTAADQANKPFRVEVGEDNNLYISDYTSPTNIPLTGNLYVGDPDLTTGTNVFGFDPSKAGRFPSSAIAQGSLGGGNLKIFGIYPDLEYAYDFFGFPSVSFNVMQSWDIGAGPLPSSVTPTRVTDLPILIADVPSVLSDIDIAPDGKYFIAQNRSQGLEAGLWVVDPAQTAGGEAGFPDIVFNSYFFSVNFFNVTNDLLFQTRAVKVSPDNKVVALIRDDNRIWIIPLTNGLPDLTGRRLMDSGTLIGLGRDVSFDSAGNLYTVSSGQAAMKSFSPGYPTRAVTGSDGTFSVTRVTGNEITLTLTDTNLAEPGDTGAFTITRSGDLSEALNVRLSYSGTASFTSDYTGAPTNITFAAGASTTNITVTALDDALGEAEETIIVTVAPGTNYISTGAFSGTLFLADDGDLPSITVSGADTNLYERLAVDTGRFVISRAGAPAGDLNVNVAYSGTAVGGTDYVSITNVITILDGQLSAPNNILVPIDNALLDGSRTIIVTVQSGAGYVLGTTTNTTLLIRDDETTPNTPVLFSEDFDTDHSANYTVRFGAGNDVDDKLVDFNFDYSTAGIPVAPNTTNGTTRGLKLTVNKDATGSAAGVNVYANGVSFSNEYVLRLDMYTTFTNVPAGTTEHDLIGLNHSGNFTNRATGVGLVGGDGVWAAVEVDGSASSTARSYALFGSTNSAVAPPFSAASARAFDTFFTIPPFAFAGYPSAGAVSRQWVDVELSQTNLNGSLIVTLKINNVIMVSRTNNTAFTSGTFMLGYMDSFNSIGSPNNFVVYDNVRVVNLTSDRPFITAIRTNGANIEVDFTAGAGDLPGAFTLESSTALPGGFGPDVGSSVILLSPGLFRATSPNSGAPQRFYRVQR